MRDDPAAAQRHLLIKAKGGFGNRMLAAVCGLIYADLSGRRPVIDWRDGAYAEKGVNAYPILFDAPDAVDPASLEDCEDVAPAIWRGALAAHPSELISRNDPIRHRDPLIYRKYCVDLGSLDVDASVAVYWSYLPKIRRIARLMARDPRFRGRPVEDIVADYMTRWFTPNVRVRDAVEAVFADAPRPVIGAHVRYTDRKTPLGKIERLIDQAVDAEPGAAVFLATDNAMVEDRLRKRHPGLITIEKWFPDPGAKLHHNKAAPDMIREAENALIDMWALARCDRLIYSRHSTFAYASYLLGGFDPSRAWDVDRWNPVVRVKQFIQEYA